MLKRLVKMSFLSDEERKLLIRAVKLMDELLETLEVMHDEGLVKDLKNVLQEVEESKTRSFNELIQELGLEERR